MASRRATFDSAHKCRTTKENKLRKNVFLVPVYRSVLVVQSLTFKPATCAVLPPKTQASKTHREKGVPTRPRPRRQDSRSA
jgi:hypothetical protein